MRYLESNFFSRNILRVLHARIIYTYFYKLDIFNDVYSLVQHFHRNTTKTRIGRTFSDLSCDAPRSAARRIGQKPFVLSDRTGHQNDSTVLSYSVIASSRRSLDESKILLSSYPTRQDRTRH